MTFALCRSDADLTAALRRVAGDALAGAQARLETDAPDAAAVHDVRKRIKMLRGLIRLVRPAFAAAEAEIAVLRGAAQGLAPVRDAEVMVMVHDRLTPGAQGPLRAMLVARVEAARGSAGEMAAAVGAARGALGAMAGRTGGWRVRGPDDAVIRAALSRTLRRGAAAMAEARDTREAEALHDWRKRVKDLWYQTRLLAPVWPEAVGVWQAAADDLGERLGEHHDLAVFGALTAAAGPPAAAEAAALGARARLMSAEIEEHVFAVGARLHAGDPDTVAALFADWWGAWREG
jgi:CHAD domain-containing protein